MEISSLNASVYDNEHDVKIDSTTKHKINKEQGVRESEGLKSIAQNLI